MYREMAGQIEARQACTGNLQRGGETGGQKKIIWTNRQLLR